MTRMRSCPCCGAPVESETQLDRACRSVPPTMATILRVVAKRPGIRLDELADEVYRNSPDGGPICAKNVISATISRQKHRLAKSGVRIGYAGGGQQSGFEIRFDRVNP